MIRGPSGFRDVQAGFGTVVASFPDEDLLYVPEAPGRSTRSAMMATDPALRRAQREDPQLQRAFSTDRQAAGRAAMVIGGLVFPGFVDGRGLRTASLNQ